MTNGRCLLACLLAGVIIGGCSAGSCLPHWTHYEGNCYRLFGGPVNWGTAIKRCRNMGSEVASVHSAGENIFLYSHWRSASWIQDPSTDFGYWLSLNDRDQEGVFVNADGSPVDFTNWIEGQPSNAGGNENCAHVWYQGIPSDLTMGWNDAPCPNTKAYFCKQSPPCY